MKKYLNLLIVALFASMSFALTSCSNDEPDTPNGGDSNDIKNFKFVSNGVTYYYGIDYSDMFPMWKFDPMDHLNSSFEVYGDNYKDPLKNTICFGVTGRSWIPLFPSDFLKEEDRNSGSRVYFDFYIKNFDYTAAQSGQKLEIENIYSNYTDTETTWEMSGSLGVLRDFSDKNSGGLYHWHNGDPIGNITFVSYKKVDDFGEIIEIITLKIEGLKMWNDLNKSKTLSLDGTITFIKDNLEI